jgi:hypothetical protein
VQLKQIPVETEQFNDVHWEFIVQFWHPWLVVLQYPEEHYEFKVHAE